MTFQTRLVRSAIVFLLCMVVAGSVQAQVAESFEELSRFGKLQPGDRVEVRGPAGQEARGVFSGVRKGSLVLFLPDEGVEATFTEPEVQRIRRSGGRAAIWGTLIGAGVATAITYAAAASYGKNEGGHFCGGCFLQWGAAVIPVGAAIGAGVGFGIDRMHRTTFFEAAPPRRAVVARPLITRRGGGVLISVAF